MLGLLPGVDALPVPSAETTQRRLSRTTFETVSTVTTLQREGLATVRVASHLPLDAVGRSTPLEVDGAHERVDERFDAVQDASERAEDRFLSAVLSTSQLTAEYAERFDDSVARVCPRTVETS